MGESRGFGLTETSTRILEHLQVAMSGQPPEYFAYNRGIRSPYTISVD
jgi:hypothetical protein